MSNNETFPKMKQTLMLGLSLIAALVVLAGAILHRLKSPPDGTSTLLVPQLSNPAGSRTGAVTKRPQIEILDPVAAGTDRIVSGGTAPSAAPVVRQGLPETVETAQPSRFRPDETGAPGADEPMSRLWEIDHSRRPPQENMDELERIFRGLIAAGTAAVPAILDFLQSGENLSLVKLSEETGSFEHESLRLALFDVLREIGGPDAEAVLLAELEATARPVEIHALAKHLDELAPEGYRVEIVEAARATLETVTTSERQKDVAKLFQVLQSYGNDDTVNTLIKEAQEWGYYATIALAGLPNDEGVTALVDLVENRDHSDSANDIFQDDDLFALQMLAQVAVNNSDARQALIEQARSDRIPVALWPRIASALAGDDQFMLEKPEAGGLVASTPMAGSKVKPHPYNTHTIGKTVIYTQHRSAKLSKTEISARVELVDRLIATSRNPTASEALTEARNMLIYE